MAQVVLDKVSKRYPGHDRDTVRPTDLEIKDREFMVLVGPSGCGKSTTLRMVAGLEDITSGQIRIGERVVNDLPPKDRDIAMVFQNYALYPHMSVYENMAFALKLRSTPRPEIQVRVEEAAKILGLSAKLDRKPKELSGGERQRVALGRAIVRRPQVFLMDEPLSNLDAKLRVQMRAEINRLHKQLQTTMIYVTHDQVEAMTMGDRIAVLHDGLVQQCDTPQVLYDLPANRFVAGFIGSPAMNFVSGRVSKGVVETGSIAFRLPRARTKSLISYEGVEVEAGLRPEHIHLKGKAPAKTDPEDSFEAEVDVVEPLGAEAFVHLRVGTQRLVSRMPPDCGLNYGQKAQFVFDREKLHLFDKASSKAIRAE